MLLLAVIAIGIEAYQVIAHTHCDLGGTVPKSHRNLFGFGIAIVLDAVSTAVACTYLYLSGGMWWLLILPILGHVFYGFVFAFARGFYMRIHDYRLETIYADNSYRRFKRAMTALDASFHLMAVILMVVQVPALLTLCAASAGGIIYLGVFSPGLVELVRKARPVIVGPIRSERREA